VLTLPQGALGSNEPQKDGMVDPALDRRPILKLPSVAASPVPPVAKWTPKGNRIGLLCDARPSLRLLLTFAQVGCYTGVIHLRSHSFPKCVAVWELADERDSEDGDEAQCVVLR